MLRRFDVYRLLPHVGAVTVPVGLWAITILVLGIGTTGSVDPQAGGAIFRDRCGACHILEKGISTHHGPNLHDIGTLAATRKPGLTAAEYLLESILQPDAYVAPVNRRGMPKNVVAELSDRDIRNIVAYLASQGAEPNYREIERLGVPDLSQNVSCRTITRHDMEVAERAMREKGECLKCHSPNRNAEYSLNAPIIFGMGLTEEAIRQSILQPDQVVAPYYHNVIVHRADGRIVTGKLIERNDDHVLLLVRNEKQEASPYFIPISEIQTDDDTPTGSPLIQMSTTSPMPAGLDKQLSPEELNAIVLMLRQLN
ncbi:MAG: c-type cytochrome [Pirellulaceae bacterium]|nr:c-type cytochrome [Planctomycetales bacterium]